MNTNAGILNTTSDRKWSHTNANKHKASTAVSMNAYVTATCVAGAATATITTTCSRLTQPYFLNETDNVITTPCGAL